MQDSIFCLYIRHHAPYANSQLILLIQNSNLSLTTTCTLYFLRFRISNLYYHGAKNMFFRLYYSITMEKTSNTDETSALHFLVLIDAIIALLLHTVSTWFDTTQNCLSKFQSFVRSHHKCGNIKVLEEKSLASELSQLPKICEKKDHGSMSIDDVKMVMESLGIFCSSEGEELTESFCSDDLSGVFDENEPSLEEVKQAFDLFDENKDGFIDARELQRVLCILGLKEGSRLEECQKMIETFDENRDGRIEFFEFVKFMEASFC